MEEFVLDTGVEASSNWSRVGGCEYNQAIQAKSFIEDIFIKPELDEILHEDKAILLAAPPSLVDPCELNIKINLRYKIAALSFVCSAPKVELFLNHQYEETIYGMIIKDEDDNEEIIEGAESISRTFRYDIEICKSGIVNLTLKFISQAKEICLYGILMLVAPNPNGVTTSNPQSINLENVEEMLKSGQKLSSNAEKCKLFLETYSKSQAKLTKTDVKFPIVDNFFQNLLNRGPSKNISAESSTIETPTIDGNQIESSIKLHIDTKLKELEQRINDRLESMEKSQNEKLDKILQMLANKL